MSETRIIKLECKCGQKIARYKKEGRGKLIKMYLNMILEDVAGIFSRPLKTNEDVFCPKCKKRLATIYIVHGRPAAKINQGAIKPVKT